MKKTVIFTNTNAFKKSKLLAWPYGIFYRTAKNPNLFELQGTPTYFWKFDGGEVTEMTRPEKLKRLDEIRKQGLDEEPKLAILAGITIVAVAGAVYMLSALGYIQWQM